jgi:tetratricopeptide (TPR) repeat protein
MQAGHRRHPDAHASSRLNAGQRGLAIAVAGLLAAAGCTIPRRLEYTPDQLRAAVARKLEVSPSGVDVPFEVDPEALEQARSIARPTLPARERARRLADALVDEDAFGIVYDPQATSSAREVLRDGRGNCLGMSSLFIALARGVGLQAYYLDASDRVRSIEESDAFIVSSGHVTAVVRTGDGDRIIDFDRSITRYRRLRVMDDLQALAHYYNNDGYDLLREYRSPDDIPTEVWEAARARFAAAIELNASLARAWNNLAISDARLGRTDDAIVHYRVAILQDSDFAAPHNNLGVLYLREGRLEDALAALRTAVELAPRNPHHYYHLALALRRSRDAEGSRRALVKVLELDPGHADARAALEYLPGRTE